MLLVYVALFIISSFLTYSRYHTLLKMNYIYTSIWCLGAVLILCGYCGLFSISEYVHFCIIVSIIVANIVYFFKNREYSIVFSPEWEIRKFDYRLIIILHIISYAIMIPIVLKSINVMLNDSGWFAIRTYAYSESIIASSLQLRIYAWFINPIFSATFLISAILWFSNSIYKKKIMILTIIDLLLITLAFGGRYNLLKFAIFFVCAFRYNQDFKKKVKSIPVKYVLVGIMIVVLLIYLTSLRSLKGLSFIQNALVYFFGSFVYFDLIIADGFSVLNNIKLCGNATFGIFTSVPMYLLNQFMEVNLTPEYLIDQTTNGFLYISDTLRYNSFTTWLFPFWKDAGLIGIIVGVAFVFIWFCYLKRKVLVKKRMSTYAMLMYLSYVILTSTLSYNLITIQQTITLLFVYALTRKANVKEQI